jgi:hypothetical protein
MALLMIVGTMLAIADAFTSETVVTEPAGTCVPHQPDFSGPVGPLRSGSTHRGHKRASAVPKIVVSYDPNDDTTSGDPDEDDDNDTTEYVTDSDDTDVPIIAWHEETGTCPIPHECPSMACAALPTSSFPTLQPLRC